MESQLFRWVGSKRHLVSRVAPVATAYLKASGGTLLSPFYGSGAIEQSVGAYDAPQVVADACPDLLALYRTLQREDGDREIHAEEWAIVQRLDVAGSESARRAVFKDVAASTPATDAAVAARFLFLCATAFNGLWRVNKTGGFNAPPDDKRLERWQPNIIALRAAAINARRLTLLDHWRRIGSFLRLLSPGCLVLSDPPYAGVFDGYTAARFSDDERASLIRSLGKAISLGCAVVAFDSPSMASAYEAIGLRIEVVKRSGSISSKGDGRGDVEELMMTSGITV